MLLTFVFNLFPVTSDMSEAECSEITFDANELMLRTSESCAIVDKLLSRT